MSIYTVKTLKGTSSALFQQKGLGGYASGPVTDTQIYAYSELSQVIFLSNSINASPDNMSANIQYLSNVYNMRDIAIAYKNGAASIGGGPTGIFPLCINEVIDLPIVTCRIKGLEDAEAKMEAIGMRQDARGIYKGTLGLKQLNTLFTYEPDNTFQEFGVVIPEAGLAHNYFWRGAYIFSGVSCIDRRCSSLIYQTCFSDYTIGTDEPQYVAPHDETATVPNLLGVGPIDGWIVANVKQCGIITVPENLAKSIWCNFLEPGETPVEDGHIFPYFRDMVVPDPEICFTIFTKLYSTTLSDNPDTSSFILETIRRGYRNLGRTYCGMALSHVYFGIDLAISSQAKFRLMIKNGKYYGFALFGEHVRIRVRGTEMQPIKPETFKEISEEFDQTNKSCRRLKEALNAHSQGPKIKNSASLATSRGIIKCFKKVDAASFGEEAQEELNGILDTMSFGEKFAEFTGPNIAKAIQQMSDGIPQIDSGIWFHDGMAYRYNDNIAMALAQFGNTAFSPRTGTDVLVIPNVGVPDTLREAATGKDKALPYLPLKPVPLSSAVQDWVTLFNTGKILYSHNAKRARNPKETWARKASFKYRLVGDDLDSIYGTIRSMVTANRKRTREDDVGDGEQVQKKRKVPVRFE